METLKGIHESMGAFLEKFKEEEDEEVNKAEIEKTVTEADCKSNVQSYRNTGYFSPECRR